MSSVSSCLDVSDRLKDSTMVEFVCLFSVQGEDWRMLQGAGWRRLPSSPSWWEWYCLGWCRQKLYLSGSFWNDTVDAGADQLCREFQSTLL